MPLNTQGPPPPCVLYQHNGTLDYHAKCIIELDSVVYESRKWCLDKVDWRNLFVLSEHRINAHILVIA